ncbi:LysM peptidoglycan-binding domain-containing protein [Aerococcus christensenii]|uniref:LysM domain protein n=1 Tax=Aerococcus christensenii TaxID=87541 RepID=A0A133Y3B0_9LACT|nr:LysM peptidoglycan-binding domain-containing protein [Aerococcus christensenii]KXB37694.1 LysM domain protein [Aerococcus christensenii]MDK8233336.1 LysM peptidoglycan-binding domain-containing protein [Aerococcus christensenii]
MKHKKLVVGTSLAATAAIAAVTAPQVNAESYTVKFGDTLSELALQFNTTIEEIRDANNIQDINKIFAGETFEIPTATKEAAPQHPVQTQEVKETAAVEHHEEVQKDTHSALQNGVYTVLAGDTLNRIAEEFGTTAQAIRDLNGIQGDLIFVGQPLQVKVGLVSTAKVSDDQDDEVIAEEYAKDAPSTEQAATSEYTVVPGDTLTKIAEAYGLNVEELQLANGLDSDFIYAGQVLAVSPQAVSQAQKSQEKAEQERQAQAVQEKAAQEKAEQERQAQAAQEKAEQERQAQEAQEKAAQEAQLREEARQKEAARQAREAQKKEAVAQPTAKIAQHGPYNGSVDPRNLAPAGQCTAYVINRLYGLGRPVPGMMGNANEWGAYAAQYGLAVSNHPQVGTAVSFPAGVAGASSYGHVGFVEAVYPDGSFQISEMNYAGVSGVNYRTIPAAVASSCQFINF